MINEILRDKIKPSEEEKRFFDLIPTPIIFYRDEEIVHLNKAALKLMDLNGVSEPIGKNIFKVFNVHEERIEEVKERLDNFINEKCTKPIKYCFSSKNASQLYFEITAARYILDGKPVSMMVINDITYKKQYEFKLEEAHNYDRLKTEFFSNISHELKTPLNIILTSIQLINTIHNTSIVCPQYQRVLNYIKMMKQNCYRLLRIINNLIDITRLDVGFLKMNFVNSDIVSVVEEITLSVVEYTNSKEIELVFDTDVEEKVMAFDPDKMERVILNLLSNAIKFTKPGGRIEVNIYDKDKVLEISVKDTGIGIPKDMLDRIFERFKQVDSLLTRSTEGSGIGLSLVKSIVEEHGGKIRVKSVLGVGSEFIVELPVRLLNNDVAVDMQLARQDKVERINIEFSDIYSN